MSKIKAIIYKPIRSTGNGIAIFVPKAFVANKMLEMGKTYKVSFEEIPYPAKFFSGVFGLFFVIISYFHKKD